MKPYPDFPLSPHPSGAWQKKIRGKIHYFGRWGHVVKGKMVRIEGDDPDCWWKEALELYKDQADDLRTEGQLKAYLQGEHNRLKKEMEERTGRKNIKIVVVLRAHKDTRYGDVFRVLNTCTKAGYSKWQLRVLQKG